MQYYYWMFREACARAGNKADTEHLGVIILDHLELTGSQDCRTPPSPGGPPQAGRSTSMCCERGRVVRLWLDRAESVVPLSPRPATNPMPWKFINAERACAHNFLKDPCLQVPPIADSDASRGGDGPRGHGKGRAPWPAPPCWARFDGAAEPRGHPELILRPET